MHILTKVGETTSSSDTGYRPAFRRLTRLSGNANGVIQWS
jgi:hypothetical protein